MDGDKRVEADTRLNEQTATGVSTDDIVAADSAIPVADGRRNGRRRGAQRQRGGRRWAEREGSVRRWSPLTESSQQSASTAQRKQENSAPRSAAHQKLRRGQRDAGTVTERRNSQLSAADCIPRGALIMQQYGEAHGARARARDCEWQRPVAGCEGQAAAALSHSARASQPPSPRRLPVAARRMATSSHIHPPAHLVRVGVQASGWPRLWRSPLPSARSGAGRVGPLGDATRLSHCECGCAHPPSGGDCATRSPRSSGVHVHGRCAGGWCGGVCTAMRCVLRCWAVPSGPAEKKAQKRLAAGGLSARGDSWPHDCPSRTESRSGTHCRHVSRSRELECRSCGAAVRALD